MKTIKLSNRQIKSSQIDRGKTNITRKYNHTETRLQSKATKLQIKSRSKNK